MQVIATKAFRTYYNYMLVRVAEGQQLKGPLAAHLLARGAPVEAVDTERAERVTEPESSRATAAAEQPEAAVTEVVVNASTNATAEEVAEAVTEAVAARPARRRTRAAKSKDAG